VGIPEMHLDAISVELDLVDPARALRDLVDGGCQRGLDESGKRRLHADFCRLFPLQRH
jgi:hypothetical protein